MSNHKNFSDVPGDSQKNPNPIQPNPNKNKQREKPKPKPNTKKTPQEPKISQFLKCLD